MAKIPSPAMIKNVGTDAKGFCVAGPVGVVDPVNVVDPVESVGVVDPPDPPNPPNSIPIKNTNIPTIINLICIFEGLKK